MLILGFICLIKGADFLVEGASSLAKKLKIPPLVIGLTIVAFGTSTPELVVSVLSSMSGSSDIAIGNVVGSNIANILLILGIAAIIFPLKVTKGTVWKEIPLSLLALIVLWLMGNDALLNGANISSLTRTDGLLLLSFFLIFLYYTYGISDVQGDADQEAIVDRKMPTAIVMVIFGLIGLVLGGHWVVDSAVQIATDFGVSEKLIGLTVVAVGTSLPELFTSAIAAYKRQADIAVGNVVGSNIFNVFFVLGVSASISPIHYAETINLDLFVACIASILLFFFMFTGKLHHLEKRHGILFVLLYVIYLGFLVLQG